MATNNFVYCSDGLGSRAFDHHSRKGGWGGHMPTKILCRTGHLNTAFRCPGYSRGFAWGVMLAAGIDSHIIAA